MKIPKKGYKLNSIYENGKVKIPLELIEYFHGNKFYIVRGLWGAIYLFTKESWDLYNSKFDSILTPQELNKLLTSFNAQYMTCDEQNWIEIPHYLREWAKLEKDVVVVRHTKRVEIWSKEKWDERQLQISNKANQR